MDARATPAEARVLAALPDVASRGPTHRLTSGLFCGYTLLRSQSTRAVAPKGPASSRCRRQLFAADPVFNGNHPYGQGADLGDDLAHVRDLKARLDMVGQIERLRMRDGADGRGLDEQVLKAEADDGPRRGLRRGRATAQCT